MNNPKSVIKEIILSQKEKDKRYKIKKNPKWLYPVSHEVTYRNIVKEIFNRYVSIVNNKVEKVLLSWKEKGILRDGEYPEDDIDELSEYFEEEDNNTYVKNSDKLKMLLLSFAVGVSSFNLTQWNNIFQKTLGFAYPLRDISDNLILKSWIYENVKLIKSATDEYKKKIEKAIFKGYKNNESYSTISERLFNLNIGLTESKSKLIARDQTTKLNSEYAKKRQEEAGVEIYIWRNMQDERVVGNPGGKYPDPTDAHGNHWIMEGKYCRWDDDGVYSEDGKVWLSRTSDMPVGKPGDEPNCRCFGEPVMKSLLNEEEVEE